MDGFRIIRRAWLAMCAIGLILSAGPSAQAQGRILARVNSRVIKESDVEFELISRSVPDKNRAIPDIRRKILDQLVEQDLVYQFLQSKNVRPDGKAVTAQMQRVRDTIERAGKDPDEVLKQLGFTPVRLRGKLSSASMWRTFLQDNISEEQIRQYFESRKEQYDGTEVRARQIYLPVKPGDSEAKVAEAEKQLGNWRKEIVAGKITFEEAARKWSQAPSKADGGDVGLFPYRGKMPADFSAAAFAQQVGDVGEPFRTRYGMHLVLVTEKIPGDFSLEDVRNAVTENLYQDFWNALVKQEREKAKIEIVGE